MFIDTTISSLLWHELPKVSFLRDLQFEHNMIRVTALILYSVDRPTSCEATSGCVTPYCLSSHFVRVGCQAQLDSNRTCKADFEAPNVRSSTGSALFRPSPFLPRELVFHSFMTSTSSLSESSDPFFLPLPFFFFLLRRDSGGHRVSESNRWKNRGSTNVSLVL